MKFGGLVPWLSLPFCRCSPDSLDSVPPAIAEGTIHHDGSHTTAKVVAKGLLGTNKERNDETRKCRELPIHKGSLMPKLTQSVMSLTEVTRLAQKVVTFQLST